MQDKTEEQPKRGFKESTIKACAEIHVWMRMVSRLSDTENDLYDGKITEECFEKTVREIIRGG